MKLTKYRLQKIINSTNKQTRKKQVNKIVKPLIHNTSCRKKKGFNLRSTTLRHY